MGIYVAASINRSSSGAISSRSFDQVIQTHRNCDVFVSHSSSNNDEALAIAQRISMNGLSAYIDDKDPNIIKDSPKMGDYIRGVIGGSRSLLALVTQATKKSWWVPFEIGLAFDKRKLLATYGQTILLPSFLSDWPNLNTYNQLDDWCHELQTGSTSTTYINRMASLASRF